LFVCLSSDNNILKQRNGTMRRFPLIRGDIALVLITNCYISSKLFDNNNENIGRLAQRYNCFIVQYKNILKSVKYFKHTRSYEPVIVLCNMNNKQMSINDNDFN
jgi:hypothetical protein